MAESSLSKSASPAHTSNILSYGHYGTATYNPDDRTWQFLRQPEPSALRHQIQSVEKDEARIVSPFRLLQNSHSAKRLHSESHDSAFDDANTHGSLSINAITKHVPQLCAAGNISLQNKRLRSNAQDGFDHFDSLDKAAFGRASVLDAEGHQSDFYSMPIVARICGSASNQIDFSCMNRECIATEDESGMEIHLEIPSIASEWQKRWSNPTKIYFVTASRAESPKESTWFAAITDHGTSLFQPALSTSKGNYRLEPNHVLQISLSHTGNQLHAHIAFHPQSAYNLAMIDIEGNWSIWSVEAKRLTSTRKLPQARLVTSGSIPVSLASRSEPLTHPIPYPIGWHRIWWMASASNTVDRILLCNSRCIYLLDLRGKILQMVDFTLKGGLPPAFVLDIKPSEHAMSEFLVLTTSHILQMTVFDNGRKQLAGRNFIRIVLSWNHFRGEMGRSLSMHVLELHQACWVLLSSCRTTKVTTYLISRTVPGQTSISDPFLHELPFSRSNPLDQIYLRHVQAYVVNQKPRTTQHNIFKMFLYQTNKELMEAVLSIRTAYWSEEHIRNNSAHIWLPSRRLMKHKSTRYISDSDIDDFITSDNEDGQIEAHVGHGQAAKAAIQPLISIGKSTHDLSATYLSIPEYSLPASSAGSQVQTFLEQAKNLIEETVVRGQSNLLLSELPLPRPGVSEIEDESENLHSFIRKIHATYAGGTDERLVHIDDRSLIEIYYDIVQDWILPLPASIPERTRLARERLARQVALDVYLSNIIIRVDDADGSESPSKQDIDVVYPSLFTNQSSELGDLFPPGSSPPLGDTSPMRKNSQTDNTNISWSKLRQLTSFTNPLPTTATAAGVQPEYLENITFHLPTSILDTDPSTYNYTATEAEFATAKTNREHSQLDPRTRRKAERLAKTRQKQLAKQEQVKKVTFDSRSIVPTITSSQMLLPIRNVQSSQIPMLSSSQGPQSQPAGIGTSTGGGRNDIISLSQPERGVHGGSAAKKSKKRKSGF